MILRFKGKSCFIYNRKMKKITKSGILKSGKFTILQNNTISDVFVNRTPKKIYEESNSKTVLRDLSLIFDHCFMIPNSAQSIQFSEDSYTSEHFKINQKKKFVYMGIST
jgi:hypothetical protein